MVKRLKGNRTPKVRIIKNSREFQTETESIFKTWKEHNSAKLKGEENEIEEVQIGK